MMKSPYILYCLLLGSLFACQAVSKERIVVLPEGKQAIFLNVAQAQKAITTDDQEQFFDKISIRDISIQEKLLIPDTMPREEVINNYKSALRADVQPFTDDEKAFLSGIIKNISRMAYKLSPDLLPQELQLIKIGGKHYGPSAFYTRENNIILPAYEIKKRDEKILSSILLHELFHIYSRYHPEKKEALYELIGFKNLNISVDQVEMPEALRRSLLLNPDGINPFYEIELENKSGEKLRCIPLTSSNFHQYSMRGADYFPHLSVNFYEIQATGDSTYTIIADPKGDNPLSFRDIAPSLFRSIGANTMYFIHPDEILADNFTLLIEGAEIKVDEESDYKDGAQLLKDIESIITAP